jgi:hypothetical protein
MHARRKPRLTYANVVATIALFLALGGSSYAALRISSKQIRNNSVRSVDIKNRTIKKKDLQKGLVGTLNAGTIEAARASGPANIKGGENVPYTRIATLSGIPTGHYVIFAKTNIAHYQSAGEAYCRLIAGDETDRAAHGTRQNGNPPETFNLEMVHSFNATGAAVIECKTTTSFWTASDSSLLALRLDSVNSSPVAARR